MSEQTYYVRTRRAEERRLKHRFPGIETWGFDLGSEWETCSGCGMHYQDVMPVAPGDDSTCRARWPMYGVYVSWPDDNPAKLLFESDKLDDLRKEIDGLLPELNPQQAFELGTTFQECQEKAWRRNI